MMHATMNVLSRNIRYAEVALGDYGNQAQWTQRITKVLGDRGITANVAKLLGFNPSKILKTERARLERAKVTFEDLKAGKKKRPQVSIDRTTSGLMEQAQRLDTYGNLIESLRETLIDTFGDVAYEAINEADDELFWEGVELWPKDDPDGDWNPDDDKKDPNVQALMESEGYYPTDLIPLHEYGEEESDFDQ